MDKIEKLFEFNKATRQISHLQGHSLTYSSNATTFDFVELKRIISFFYSASLKYGKSRIIYDLHFSRKVKFADKLTYILLECLLYDLIVRQRKQIRISKFDYEKDIKTDGLDDSCIKLINNIELFKKEFEMKLFLTHYRKVISYKKFCADESYLSITMGDINNFFTNYSIAIGYAKMLSEISIELIDNAMEHTHSDCLIDIDFSQNYLKKGEPGVYFTINISVVDFSEKLMGEDIKILNEDIDNIKASQFNKLREIYDIHSNYFDDDYTEKDFYMLSAFQNGITSRKGEMRTGGRGLSLLIKGLQSSAEAAICYMVSGQRTLFFHNDCINQDKDKWVGFNIENDITKKPNVEIIKESPINIQGTAYNLTFIIRKE